MERKGHRAIVMQVKWQRMQAARTKILFHKCHRQVSLQCVVFSAQSFYPWLWKFCHKTRIHKACCLCEFLSCHKTWLLLYPENLKICQNMLLWISFKDFCLCTSIAKNYKLRNDNTYGWCTSPELCVWCLQTISCTQLE